MSGSSGIAAAVAASVGVKSESDAAFINDIYVSFIFSLLICIIFFHII